jgi:hypothetical protein
MAIRRITISMPETLAEEIKKAAGDRPVWRWVQEVLEERATDEELNHQWEEFYMDVNPDPKAIKQADEMFERLTMPSRDGRQAGRLRGCACHDNGRWMTG